MNPSTPLNIVDPIEPFEIDYCTFHKSEAHETADCRVLKSNYQKNNNNPKEYATKKPFKLRIPKEYQPLKDKPKAASTDKKEVRFSVKKKFHRKITNPKSTANTIEMDTDEDFENESTCEESEGSQDEELEISTLQIDIVDLPEPANIDKAPVHIPITQNEDCLKATAFIDGGKIDVIPEQECQSFPRRS